MRIQRATPRDLRALCELEQIAFSGDRISTRSWRRLLSSPSATVTVVRAAGPATRAPRAVLGAAVTLRRSCTSVARLYSIAVAPSARGRGVAGQLLDDAAHRMRHAGAAVLRLETRIDNHTAQALFQRHGFLALDRKPAYYEDGADALRFQKPLRSLVAGTGGPALRAPARPLDLIGGSRALLMVTATMGPPDDPEQAPGAADHRRITRDGERRRTAAIFPKEI